MASEMIMRVAKAIADADEWPGNVTSNEVLARAAIKAMREPTEGMVIAGWHGSFWDEVTPESCWQHMIDAALKDE